jgi:hypothetical protein
MIMGYMCRYRGYQCPSLLPSSKNHSGFRIKRAEFRRGNPLQPPPFLITEMREEKGGFVDSAACSALSWKRGKITQALARQMAMENNGPLVCFGVTLLPVLFLGYIYLRKSRDKSRHPSGKAVGDVSSDEYTELENTPKKPYSMSEEIRKLWKYN